jgi:hypothetical protein
MIWKAIHELGRPVVYLFDFGGVTLFSALGLFGVVLLRADSDGQRTLRRITIAMIAMNALFLAPLMSGDAFVGPLRYFDVFVPLLVPWGVLAFGRLLEQSDAPRWAIVLMLLLFLAGLGVQSARDPFAASKAVPLSMVADIRGIVPRDDVMIASSLATALAWYADRRNISTFVDSGQAVATLDKLGLDVRWYFAGLDDPPPPGFSLVREWRPGGFALWRRP